MKAERFFTSFTGAVPRDSACGLIRNGTAQALIPGPGILSLLFLVSLCFNLSAQDVYTIEGTVAYSGEGPVYVYLVDEETSSVPLTGLSCTLFPSGTSPGVLPFSFTGLEPGVYGIRCFQDSNGNGKLDRGLFGPKEPWGMSWQGEKPEKWPKWESFCFELNEDRGDVRITLEG